MPLVRALVYLSPDMHSRSLHCNALLASGRFAAALRGFTQLRVSAPTRRWKVVAEHGQAIALALIGKREEAIAMQVPALWSPFADLASLAAMNLALQAWRCARSETLELALAACEDTSDDRWPRAVADLLHRHLPVGDPAAGSALLVWLGRAGCRGDRVADQLEKNLCTS